MKFSQQDTSGKIKQVSMSIVIAIVALMAAIVIAKKLREAYLEVKREKIRQKKKEQERIQSQKDWHTLKKQWQEAKEKEPVRSEEILRFVFREVKMDLYELAINMYNGREYFKPVRFPEEKPYSLLITNAKESLNELQGVFPDLTDDRLKGYAQEGLKFVPSHFMSCLENLYRKYKGAQKTTFPPGVETLSDFWAYSRDEISSVRIDNSVLVLGKHALKDCHSLRQAYLPENLKEIGEEAFKGCHLLDGIHLPKIVMMGNEAFANCFNLTSITLPGTLEVVPQKSFARCWNLSTVIIEDGVKEIQDEAFRECYNLKHIELPDSIERLGTLIFKDCRALKSVRIPARLRKDSERLFNKYTQLPKLYS